MSGRDHSCEVCGRGGFNDPDGDCVCPDGSVPQEIVEKNIKALQAAAEELTARATAKSNQWGWRQTTTKAVVGAYLAALSLDDIQALLQAKSDMDVLYLDTWRVIAFRATTTKGNDGKTPRA